MRPKALDLFCGAGGAAMGLHRAGFDVVGIDNRPQPRYPFPFILGDALQSPVRLGDFDLVWASPPCQAHTTLRGLGKARSDDVDLIQPVRAMLAASRALSVIENVPGAPLHANLRLCGSHFGLEVRRHRIFEPNFDVSQPRCACRSRKNIAVYGKAPGHRLPDGVRRARDLSEGRRAMGIDWMEWQSLTQAIPPAYSEYIGRYALMAI